MIGKRLKQVRKYLKLTQVSLAEKMSITQGTYNRYENDNIEPNIQFLHNYCVYFNIDINWLITGQGNMLLNSVHQSSNNDLEKQQKRLQDLQKQVDHLKKNIQDIELEYDQEKKRSSDLISQNQELNNELLSLMRDLIECKNLIIKLQQK